MPSVRQLATDHATRIVGQLPQELAAQLGTDPCRAISGQGIEVAMRPEEPSGNGCSVDGSYRKRPIPRITVAEAASRARRRFTALHEYGHHLIQHDGPIHEVFLTMEDGGEALEEAIADAIAAELLLPTGVVDVVIGARGPSAVDVVELHRRSGASREACCVRAAQRLVGSGYVILGEGQVARFAACVGTLYRIARGTPQGPDSLLARAAARGSAREQTRVRFRSGHDGELLWGDAQRDDGYVFAVITDHPAWEKLRLRDPQEVAPRYEGSCRTCERDFDDAWRRCPQCGEPRCPRCGDCWCDKPTVPGPKRTCTVCFLPWPLDHYTGGSTVCKDCI